MILALITSIKIGGRSRTNCCKVSKPPLKPLTCSITTCDIEASECLVGGDLDGNKKRDSNTLNYLEERGPKRPYKWYTDTGLTMLQYSLSYPSPPAYMRLLRQSLTGISNRWYQMRSRSCSEPSLQSTAFDNVNTPPPRGQVEHIIPVSMDQHNDK